jgi:uncharacterized protein (DUF1684 family)
VARTRHAAGRAAQPALCCVDLHHVLTQNPWLTLLLIGLYEIIVFCVGFLVKVYQKLEGTWVDASAAWVENHLQTWFSDTYKQYRQHLIHKYRDVDVKGLSTQNQYTLALQDVFVEEEAR